MNEVVKKIKSLYNEYIEKNGYAPRYCECEVQFVGCKSHRDIIAVGVNYNEKYDNEILFYCETLNDLIGLAENSLEDFIITDIYEFFDEL